MLEFPRIVLDLGNPMLQRVWLTLAGLAVAHFLRHFQVSAVRNICETLLYWSSNYLLLTQSTVVVDFAL